MISFLTINNRYVNNTNVSISEGAGYNIEYSISTLPSSYAFHYTRYRNLGDLCFVTNNVWT